MRMYCRARDVDLDLLRLLPDNMGNGFFLDRPRSFVEDDDVLPRTARITNNAIATATMTAVNLIIQPPIPLPDMSLLLLLP